MTVRPLEPTGSKAVTPESRIPRLQSWEYVKGHKEYNRVSFRQGLSSLFGASEHDAAESLAQW